MNPEELKALQAQLSSQIEQGQEAAAAAQDPGLKKALEAATALSEKMASADVPVDASVDPTYLGLTAGALFAGLVLSSIGVGMVIYGKSQVRLIFVLFGVLLFALPFVATTTPWLIGVGSVLVVLPIALNRYVQF